MNNKYQASRSCCAFQSSTHLLLFTAAFSLSLFSFHSRPVASRHLLRISFSVILCLHTSWSKWLTFLHILYDRIVWPWNDADSLTHADWQTFVCSYLICWCNSSVKEAATEAAAAAAQFTVSRIAYSLYIVQNFILFVTLFFWVLNQGMAQQ